MLTTAFADSICFNGWGKVAVGWLDNKKALAYQDYLNGMKYKDIAVKHNVSLSLVKKWASKDWRKFIPRNSVDVTKNEKVTQQEKLQARLRLQSHADTVDMPSDAQILKNNKSKTDTPSHSLSPLW